MPCAQVRIGKHFSPCPKRSAAGLVRNTDLIAIAPEPPLKRRLQISVKPSVLRILRVGALTVSRKQDQTESREYL